MGSSVLNSTNKKLIQVWLEKDMIVIFDRLKKRLHLKNDTEVLRHAIVFTENNDKGHHEYV